MPVRLFAESPSPRATVGAIIKRYLFSLAGRVKASTFSADHLGNNRRDLANFEAFVGSDRDVSDCRQYDLTEWLASNPGWKSVCTKRNALASVLACFRWAEEEEIIDRCPYRRPRALRGESDKPRRPAQLAEYLCLYRAGSKSLRRALFFLWHTGARTCEMRLLTWEDLRLDGQHPHIWLERHKTFRKTGKPRVIALDPVVAKFLRWLQKRSRGRFVFTNTYGGEWDRHTFARHLRRTAQRIGMDDGVAERISAYCLRHSYTCNALEGGATTKQVADLLGHSDTKMVERVYGSHTARHVDYLSRTVEAVRLKRK